MRTRGKDISVTFFFFARTREKTVVVPQLNLWLLLNPRFRTSCALRVRLRQIPASAQNDASRKARFFMPLSVSTLYPYGATSSTTTWSPFPHRGRQPLCSVSLVCATVGCEAVPFVRSTTPSPTGEGYATLMLEIFIINLIYAQSENFPYLLPLTSYLLLLTSPNIHLPLR